MTGLGVLLTDPSVALAYSGICGGGVRFSRRLANLLFLITFLLVPLCSPRAADVTPQTLQAGQVLRGDFIQDRALSGFARPLRTTGSFLLVPGQGLIWKSEKPFANTTVITPSGILQLANGHEAMRLPASRLPGLGHLYEALGAAVSGNIKPLTQTFAVAQSSAGGEWKIVLTPLNPDNPAMSVLKSLTLIGGRFVDSVEVDKSGGDVDHMSFRDQAVMQANLTSAEKALLGALGK